VDGGRFIVKNPKANGRMEELGEQYFDELVSRSFFQRSNNNNSCFLMHDLVNDLAKYILGEFCYRMEIDNLCEFTKKKTRHLSFFTTKFDAKKFEVSCAAKSLRTFLGLKLSYGWSSSFDKIAMRMINDLLHTSKRLRVLSLSDHQNLKLLPDFVGNLKIYVI